MIYRFGDYSLDTATFELRARGAAVPVEPQVFALLRLLIENRDRVLSRDEIIDAVWNGRIISDAALSSRIKSARAAVGDDGESQRVIRTITRTGFRFIAALEDVPVAASAEPLAPPEPQAQPINRPSIAVLPFSLLGDPGETGWLAEAIPHELIAELSRLHWLFVIARGSSFRFGGASLDAVRAALGVRYCLSGSIEPTGNGMTIAVELADTGDQGVVWSDRFRASLDGVQELRAAIAAAVINALEFHVPLHEAQRASTLAPASLDAWGAFHLGLRHLYRFDRAGNAQAAELFTRAIALDPSFARAHAGLSFTHFEDAFLRFSDSPQRSAAAARASAEEALARDQVDPFCNLVMGRSFWLGGELEASLPWLERSLQLNPNYAQAHYARGWTTALIGQVGEGEAAVDTALSLSPLDPLAYGMFGVRAFSRMAAGDTAGAAAWGERAALTPGAHALIEMIAAVGHGLNGADEQARTWLQSARRRQPGLTTEHFFGAFPFRQEALRQRVGETLARLEA
jgi:TolB-like protein